MPLDPSTISGLKLWYKPESLSGNDGDAITTWTDSSASGVNLTQSNAGFKPQLKTNISGFNGFNVARFDGTDDRMVMASALQVVDAGALYSIFCVCKRVSGTGTGNVIDNDNNGANRTWQFRYKDGSNFEGIAFDTLGNPYFDTETITPGNANVISLVREATQQTVRVNGTGTATATSNTAGQVANSTLTIGAFNNGAANFVNVDIAEILIYAGALSAANRIKIEVYLAAKYKIAGANGPGLIVPSRNSRSVHIRR